MKKEKKKGTYTKMWTMMTWWFECKYCKKVNLLVDGKAEVGVLHKWRKQK